MPDLNFSILSAEIKSFAAAPTMLFKLQIANAVAGEEVYAVGLRGQVMIDAIHRTYSPETRARLMEVFGTPERWDETMKSIFWTNVTIPVPRFEGQITVDVPIICGEDLELGAGKYFYAIEEGMIPLSFLFSGSVFYRTAEAALQVTQIPWEKEATFKLPAQLWREMIDQYYPNQRWLKIQKDTFDRLYRFKAARGFPTLEACLEELIRRTEKSQNR